VFDDFENVPELYDLAPGSNDLLEIAEIANKIWNDIENSKDTVKPSKNDKEGEGLPKK
jgi:hypothetical protein